MTVIAFDGRTVAADKQASGYARTRTVTKLFQVHGDDAQLTAILAICGSASDGLQLVAWYKAGANPEKFPPRPSVEDQRANLVVFRPGKHPMQYEYTPIPVVFEDPIFAAGCGGDLALGAMLAGADAKRAVEIASMHDEHCGHGVDVMELYGDPDVGSTCAASPGTSASS
jgi:20S proteasome alpha/beta subunit